MGKGKHGTLLSIIEDFEYLLEGLSGDQEEDILALKKILIRLKQFKETYIEKDWV